MTRFFSLLLRGRKNFPRVSAWDILGTIAIVWLIPGLVLKIGIMVLWYYLGMRLEALIQLHAAGWPAPDSSPNTFHKDP